MKLKCEFCGAIMSDTDPKCANCGAANVHVKAPSSSPKTIAELKAWYASQKLPSEEITRFFIGKDYKGARAFGIYQNPKSGAIVVYKNNTQGQRIVHYEGGDEAYAVNEIYLKLKEAIAKNVRK